MAKPVAMPRGSTPASSLGFRVVQRLTWLATWKVHRCTFVPGHTSLTAAKSGEMPQIAILGSGDVQHQRRPGGPALALRQVPADDIAARYGDQHDDLPAKPYAVQEHNVVNLAAVRRYRPYPPGPHCLVPKRRSAGLQIRYRVL